METRSLPNELFLNEVSAILAEGKHVTIRAKGNSMLPFIHNGYDVELRRKDDVCVGDIVLAYTKDARYVLHRIIDMEGDEIVLMGDGNLCGTELCGKKDISGVVSYIIDRKGRKKDCNSTRMRARGRMWMWLKPIRRYLIGIYKRLICV